MGRLNKLAMDISVVDSIIINLDEPVVSLTEIILIGSLVKFRYTLV
jgi:hypothetical protein